MNDGNVSWPEVVQQYIADLGSSEWNVRNTAVLNLAAMDRFAGPAIPALSKTLHDECDLIRRNTINTLMIIGEKFPEAAAPLLGMLNDPDAEIRRLAGMALAQLGGEASEHVPTPVLKEWIHKAIEKLVENRYSWCGVAVREINATGERAMPILIEFLKDENPRVRNQAAWVIGEMHEKAWPAVPALIKLLNDEDKWVRRRADDVLTAIGPKVIPELVNAVMRKKIFYEQADEIVGKIRSRHYGIQNGVVKMPGERTDQKRTAARRAA